MQLVGYDGDLIKVSNFQLKKSLFFKGTLYVGGMTPSKLFNVKIQTYDSVYCNNVLTYVKKNWNSQICAGLYIYFNKFLNYLRFLLSIKLIIK